VSPTVITVTELRRHTYVLARRCEAGEVFIVTRYGVPVVMMRPLTEEERTASSSIERVEIDTDLLREVHQVFDPNSELSDREVVHLALQKEISTQQLARERTSRAFDDE